MVNRYDWHHGLSLKIYNSLHKITIDIFIGMVYSLNSVHLHECSPFWVGIFIILCKENYNVH